jgi:hypothetical protein
MILELEMKVVLWLTMNHPQALPLVIEQLEVEQVEEVL